METGRARHRVVRKHGVERLRLPAQRNWTGSAFLGCWLAGWFWVGLGVARHTFDLFAVLWSILWLAVSCGTALLLLGQLVGADLVSVERDALVITRRAGPFARTWRYRTSLIRDLRVDLSPWAREGTDGAQYLVLGKQQWGAVRFDYHAETVHLAPGVHGPEAAQILEWLRRRLPAAATARDRTPASARAG